MLYVLITLQDVQENLSALFVCLDLHFLHSQEANYNSNLFIFLQSAYHRLNSENLLCLFTNGKVVLDGILSLVFQEESLLFGLTNSHGVKVECLVDLHGFVESNVESLRI